MNVISGKPLVSKSASIDLSVSQHTLHGFHHVVSFLRFAGMDMSYLSPAIVGFNNPMCLPKHTISSHFATKMTACNKVHRSWFIVSPFWLNTHVSGVRGY